MLSMSYWFNVKFIINNKNNNLNTFDYFCDKILISKSLALNLDSGITLIDLTA